MNLQPAFHSAPIDAFLRSEVATIIGGIVEGGRLSQTPEQLGAWQEEIRILQHALKPYAGAGRIYFELSIPRLGKRIDVLCVIKHVIFILEFKVGQDFDSAAEEQVQDYALDLKNFHYTSHDVPIAPILIATESDSNRTAPELLLGPDKIFKPILIHQDKLTETIERILSQVSGSDIDAREWESGYYHPTPTIVQAATALYRGHEIAEISRSDAGAQNLLRTSQTVDDVIHRARKESFKAICFVTGVPGAGKTLVGLDIATKHNDPESELHSVFLSGNGPLVNVLCEALARDAVDRSEPKERKGKGKGKGKSRRVKTLTEARREVKVFIQNVHHFRDDCLNDVERPPIEHVALFDEAQRAWNKEQTMRFMKRRKGNSSFDQSEPEFLISCMDRHSDWAVIVCLVGGGQEINTGEAGIAAWVEAVIDRFPNWHVFISPQLRAKDYATDNVLERASEILNLEYKSDLHLSVPMRSFRSEAVSRLVHFTLDMDVEAARKAIDQTRETYPIYLTRDLDKAKEWLRNKARGTERYGIVVSSQAERLRPHAIDVTSPMDPVHWFLNGKEDVRSSFYLESVATEFHVQGLEVDWACVTWDADFRAIKNKWQHWSFKGDRWEKIVKDDRRRYQKNAYRVLLTRARQGMVIVVPEGDRNDHTRPPSYYDGTYDYLRSIGFDDL
ncbi:MAG: DUF2075 domain-containing protein [Bacteroidetes bacterium]|nr:DUF2075 domain-containing protein [Bacteroidota bacterium]